MTRYQLFAAAGLCLLALSACSRSGDIPILMNAASHQDDPDEFSIVPTGALQAPADFSTLPPPTPGGTNLVDPDPRAQAVVALGGRVSAERTSGIPAADAGLVGYAGRGGVSGDIRATLAAEDLELRRDNNPRLLERAFNTNVYRQAYEEQLLDPQEELRRWRARGVRTPAAPPQR
ncbi:DUF3035 domain-containing protein [Pararhodobacter sp.]|uniref:DUF3035 domain-containing protein n=1 Tax=Pararhodobacter sp. TaxID=2127056 RepID=UPI002AFF7D0B|nr:DUF3035 domain-containing protein [Pararhodobacter sp.]